MFSPRKPNEIDLLIYGYPSRHSDWDYKTQKVSLGELIEHSAAQLGTDSEYISDLGWAERYSIYWESPHGFRVVIFGSLVDVHDRPLTNMPGFITLKFFYRDGEYWRCYKTTQYSSTTNLIKQTQYAADTAQIDITDIVRRQVQNGVAQAVEQNVKALEKVESEKERIQAQIDKLEKRKLEIEEIERRAAERKAIDAQRQAEREAKRLERQQIRSGFVYLLKSNEHPDVYKIGRSVNPTNRAKTFGVKLPFPVEFECLISTPDMYELEAELHARFAAQRLDGEWFRLSEQDVSYIRQLGE